MEVDKLCGLNVQPEQEVRRAEVHRAEVHRVSCLGRASRLVPVLRRTMQGADGPPASPCSSWDQAQDQAQDLAGQGRAQWPVAVQHKRNQASLNVSLYSLKSCFQTRTFYVLPIKLMQRD